MAPGAQGLPSHPTGEEEEEGVWAFGHPLPAWLLQGRVGITPPWPRCSYLLTLWAWHTTVSLQSKERRVQGAFLPLHHTAHTELFTGQPWIPPKTPGQ